MSKSFQTRGPDRAGVRVSPLCIGSLSSMCEAPKKCPVRLKIGCHGNRAEVLSVFRVDEDDVSVSKERDGIITQRALCDCGSAAAEQ